MKTIKKIYLLTATACYLALGATAQWQTASPNNNTVRHDDIFFLNCSLGWSVGADGRIHKTTDGGSNWSQIANISATTNRTTYLRSVGFFNANLGFAGNVGPGLIVNTLPTSNRDILFKTTDGGSNWSPINLPLPYTIPNPSDSTQVGICAIQIVDSNTIMVAGRVRGPAFIWKSTDKGNTWTYIDLRNYCKSIMDIHFTSPSTGFVVGGTNAYVDLMPNNPITPNAARSRCDGYNQNSVILYTNDGGQSWFEKIRTPFNVQDNNNYAWKIDFPTSDTGYVSIQQNNTPYNKIRFFRTFDAGQSWTYHEYPISVSMYVQGIGFKNGKEGFVGGSGSYFLFETRDAGQSWSIVNGSGRRINRIRFLKKGYGQNVLGFASGTDFYKYGNLKPDCSTTIPAQLKDFQGKCTDGGVALKWEVEPNNSIKNYELLRSIDNTNYISRGVFDHIAGKTIYEATDADVSTFVYQYQLKIINQNDDVLLSPKIMIDCDTKGYEFKTKPNPVLGNQALEISYSLPKTSQVEINIYDFSGRVYATIVKKIQTQGTYTEIVDFPKGIAEFFFVNFFVDGQSKASETIFVRK